MRRKPLQGWRPRALHAGVLVAGWGLFVYAWWHVLAVQTVLPGDIALLITGSLLVFPLLTLVWVLHNRRIYRQKGPRTSVRHVESDYARDWNGRTVHADWPALRTAKVVVIEVDTDRKHYRST